MARPLCSRCSVARRRGVFAFGTVVCMKLFEVIFWGSHGDGNAKDTIYLVRAPDFRTAIEDVQCNASPSDHNGDADRLAHVVYEVGTDLSPYAESDPCILRGPYFASAYNRGWKAWHRKIEGSSYSHEWEEETQIAEPGASQNGGPATPLGDSGVIEGPPSVS